MTSSAPHEGHQTAFRWSWQDPCREGSFFAIHGAYELAYARPARQRSDSERDGYLTYLIAAKVRNLTGERPSVVKDGKR